MTLEERIAAFETLGRKISSFSSEEQEKISRLAEVENAWFTNENVNSSLNGIQKYLDKNMLLDWSSKYAIEGNQQKHAGIVMAGNIPLVGFHDLLSVLVAGFHAQIKPSTDDTFLTKHIINLLIEIEPRFEDKITFPETIKDADFFIATGSDNTARYFEYYFRNKPNLIRKNRTSVAVLNGNESEEQIKLLGKDIFQYFGLGCRNVSKLFHPANFDIRDIFPPLQEFEEIIHHHKYRNNYDYNKSILLVNREPHLDTGFLLTKEDKNLVSPISVLFTEAYDTPNELKAYIDSNNEKIQCMVTSDDEMIKYPNAVHFGEAQQPNLWDYADGVDTMEFLVNQY